MFSVPEQTAHRYYDLFNARRLDETEKLIASEALFHYPGVAHHLVGPAGHRTLSQLWLTAFPDLQLRILATRSSDDRTIVTRSIAQGTHQGPLRLGDVAVPATGRRVLVEFKHVLEVQDGRITGVSLQLDVKALVRQLTDGAAPP
jgi:steroid delta-isomerase-like uncharacterized protein